MADSSSFQILVVGDVHELWDSESESAVRALAPDLLLFVGDYGDEAEEVVERIAKFCSEYDDATSGSSSGKMACAVLGNHEALRHALDPKLDTGAPLRQRALLKPFNPLETPRRTGNGPAVLGGRPFSFGGPDNLFSHVDKRFGGVSSIEDSARRMCRDIDSIDKDTPVIFLSHNGPSGLGSKPADICGNDYEKKPVTGDHGDPDLRTAIEYARTAGRRLPLVTFGHFHRTLQRDQGTRTMVAADGDGDNIAVYVNAAFVPRIKSVKGADGKEADSKQHHFMSIRLDSKDNWNVQKVDAIWCNSRGEIGSETCYYDIARGGLTNAE